MVNLQEIAEIIKNNSSFALFTHTNADGDAIGSILGLGLSLKLIGKRVAYFVPEPVPGKFSFIKDFELINIEKPEGFEVGVLLDAAESTRIDKLEIHLEKFKVVINIDHHASNGHFGRYNFVDVNAPSTTSIIYRLIELASFPINPDIANALFTGLMTDTGSFHYANANIEAFKVASLLVEKGASPDYIGRMVYEQEKASKLQVLGVALERIKVDNNIAYSYVTINDLEKFSASMDDTDGIIDIIRKVKQAVLVVLFKEISSDEVRVSLRGKNGLNVGDIASHFGGGGHPQAAGFTIGMNLFEAMNVVIEYIKEQFYEKR